MPSRFRDLKRYLETHGWVLVRNTDHFYYQKVLADGTVLRTRVSHTLHKEIPPGQRQAILKHQLKVTEAEFWHGPAAD